MNKKKCAALVISNCYFMIAHAANQFDVDDARCMIVGLRLATSPEPRDSSAGGLLVLYSLGRLKQANTVDEIKALLARETKLMNPQSLQRENLRCSKLLVEEGKEIQAIGNALTSSGL